MSTARLAFVGIGSRGYNHLKNAYTISNQPYLLGDEPDEVDRVHLSGNSHRIYHEYAKDIPDWAEDTSDLTIEVTAVYDPSSEARSRAVELCQENGDNPNVYKDWDAFLDGDEYDAAVVSTPNHTHADVVVPLMEQGLDVLCEKPLATTLEDHDRIIDADRNSNGILYVGFNARHSPARKKIRRAILNGEIGELGMLSVDEVRHPFPMGHFYSQEESGGSLLDKNCHDFDYFNWIVDADPVKVYALGGQHVFTKNNDVNDHSTVIYEYDNGIKASLELCLYAPFTQSGGRQQRFRGSDGVIRTTNDDGSFVICTRDERKPVDVQSKGSHGGADPLMWHDFLSCIIRGTERMASPIDAKKASAVAIGAEKAIRNDNIVEITPNYNLE